VIYALLFGAVALVGALMVWAAVQVGAPWLAVPFAWGACAFAMAALAYGGVGPGVFGKRADGTVPGWSYVLSGPFLVVGRAGLRAFNATGLETPWSQVDTNLWLGRRPQGPDGEPFAVLAPVAVLDMTAEVARSRRLRGSEAYLVLPTLDNASPSAGQLDEGIRFIEAHRGRGPVYVHCALGNGRAATMLAAWMLASGKATGIEQAEDQLRAMRPSVGLSRAQRIGLSAWWDARGAPWIAAEV
jgi:hypothetical protein